MLRHGKWRAPDSPNYLPPLDNFTVRNFLMPSRFSVSFIRAFNPFFINNLNSFRISSQSNLFSLWHDRLRKSKGFKTFINTAYKKKANKVQPIDSDKSDSSTPSNSEDWK
jgi:hypothetical protein